MNNHPYKALENSILWKIVDKAIEDLVHNKDIKESTNREYIVGYICKLIIENRED